MNHQSFAFSFQGHSGPHWQGAFFASELSRYFLWHRLHQLSFPKISKDSVFSSGLQKQLSVWSSFEDQTFWNCNISRPSFFCFDSFWSFSCLCNLMRICFFNEVRTWVLWENCLGLLWPNSSSWVVVVTTVSSCWCNIALMGYLCWDKLVLILFYLPSASVCQILLWRSWVMFHRESHQC